MIALVVANQAADEEEATRTSEQIRRAQDELATQVDRLDTRMQALPTADDVSALDERLKRVEDDTAGIPDDLESLEGRVADLEGRVDEVERQIEANSADTGTDTNDSTAEDNARSSAPGALHPETREGRHVDAPRIGVAGLVGECFQRRSAGPLPTNPADGATGGLRLTGPSSGLAAGHLQGPKRSVTQVRTTSFPWCLH